MRLACGMAKARERAVTLIELLIYAPIFLLVVGLAFGCFFEAQSRSAHLRRFAEQTESVLLSGEQWRASVREATRVAVIRRPEEKATYLELASRDKTNVFMLADGGLFRWQADRERWVPMMSRLADGAFAMEMRGGVEVVRLEVALPPVHRSSKQLARLTFQAVPGGENGQ
jgi:hypothetical protein